MLTRTAAGYQNLPSNPEEESMDVTVFLGRPQWCSEAEWKVRCDLAALYRLMAHHRWTDLIFTPISARIPGPEHHFLINRYGVLFHEMRASDLVKIDCEAASSRVGRRPSR